MFISFSFETPNYSGDNFKSWMFDYHPGVFTYRFKLRVIGFILEVDTGVLK